MWAHVGAASVLRRLVETTLQHRADLRHLRFHLGAHRRRHYGHSA
jgi:hypothetical protein